MRLYAGAAITAALLFAIAALTALDRPASPDGALPPILDVNLIALVDEDRRALTVDPGGFESRPIALVSETDDGLFAWPTWSPDAGSLLLTKVEPRSDQPEVSLELIDLATGNASVLHSGRVQPMAVGVFYYPLWSHDGSRLAFIASEGDSLNLFVDDLADASAPAALLDDGPLWMSWSHDSRRLLVHRADAHFLVDVAEDEIETRSLGLASGGYRVPAWRPGTDTATILAQSQGGGFELLDAEVSMNAGIGETEPLADVSGAAAFLWSPNGRSLAVAGPRVTYLYLGLAVGVHSSLTVHRPASGGEPLEVPDAVLACFWAPDASRIAYVSLADTPGVLRWMMLDVSDGRRWPLVDFVPTIDQLTMFQFFDQYAYSHSLWSPDGRALVFAGVLDDQAAMVSYGAAQDAARPYVYVVDADPDPAVSAIAEGLLGIWSPR